jgi:hypothetical protein
LRETARRSSLGAEGAADEAVEGLEERVRAMPAPEAHVCLDPATRAAELAERRVDVEDVRTSARG